MTTAPVEKRPLSQQDEAHRWSVAIVLVSSALFIMSTDAAGGLPDELLSRTLVFGIGFNLLCLLTAISIHIRYLLGTEGLEPTIGGTLGVVLYSLCVNNFTSDPARPFGSIECIQYIQRVFYSFWAAFLIEYHTALVKDFIAKIVVSCDRFRTRA